MSTGVGISSRTIIDIRIAIKSLHAAGNNRIRLGETSQGGVVPAGVVVHETEVRGVRVLSRVRIVGGSHAGIVSYLPPGGVAQFGDGDAALGQSLTKYSELYGGKAVWI